MIVLALLAAGLGGHAVGFGKGRRSGRRTTLKGISTLLHNAWEQGWDASERFGYPVDPEDSFENPYPLPEEEA